MGKKKTKVNYDENTLKNLASHIYRIRKPIEAKNFPRININLKGLEKAVLQLPKKDKEILEKFWGLIPGTTDFSKKVYSKNRKANDVAYYNMMKMALEAAEKLLFIEYMYLYDEEVGKIVDQILSKVDRSGVEEISDIDVIKYLIIFLIFYSGGPSMVFKEENEEIDLEREKNGHFDEYALLKATWEGSAIFLEDNSINLKLLVESISMFDLKDVLSMKRFARLPISKWDSEIETEPLTNFCDIRLFKEKLFPYGEWEVIVHLIYYNGTHKADLEQFAEHCCTLRSNWKNMKLYENGKQKIKISAGEKEIQVYNIGGLKFTDIYEVMYLYVSRSIA